VLSRTSMVALPPWIHLDEVHSAKERAGLAHAIDEAIGCFVAVELGAGWGPWLVAAHAAARRKGIRNIRLIGVEACREHVEMLHQHFADNGILPSDHVIIHGAVGPHDGTAWFPEIDPMENWGQPAHFYPTPNMSTLPCISFPTLLRDHAHANFIHCDIQGSEYEVLPAAIETLNCKVRRVIVGTHSPEIDAQMRALFEGHHWHLEAAAAWTSIDDGTQVWHNKMLNVRRKPSRGWGSWINL